MDVREKLVKQAISHFEYGVSHDIFSEPVTTYAKLAIEALEKEKESCVTVQEWIPASEPPKKITNKVIVLCKNGYMGYGHYEDYKGERTWYNLESGKPFTDWDLEDCEGYGVTHWMPLPPAPEDMK